jgi:autotransporter-associated beta strand protein
LFRCNLSHGVPCFLLIACLSVNAVRAEDWSPLWTTANLSAARYGMAATSVDGKILLAGGRDSQNQLSNVDIYDISTAEWSTTNLSVARSGLAATSSSGKAFFGGGTERVDIYDSSSGAWSTASLSLSRGSLAAASAKDKVLFAGGAAGGGWLNRVDIFDTQSGSWSKAQLSQGRAYLAAASANEKVVFAGGWNYPLADPSDVVDIYNSETGEWSTARLSQERIGLAAASAGGSIFFGGGAKDGLNGYTPSNVVDVFNAATGNWTVSHLSQARTNLAATAIGGKVFFGGGVYYDSKSTTFVYSDVVDIYDVASDTWSTSTLSLGRDHLTAAAAGHQVFFAGGVRGGSNVSNVVDIYTIQNYDSVVSSKSFTLVDKTTVAGRMTLDQNASLSLGNYDLSVGSMAGIAAIDLTAGVLTVGGDNTDSIYSGNIGGSGAFCKVGYGILTLSGDNSYFGSTAVSAGELVLMGPNAWNPIINLGGARLSGGQLVFDYTGDADPYATIASLLGTRISGSMPLEIVDDVANSRVIIISAVPEPSTIALLGVGGVGLLGYVCRKRQTA